MTNAWDADTELSAQAAGELIAAQFPSLAPVRLELFGVGWDNAAYLVNGLRDVENDRAHPVKRMRPIARGEVTTRTAYTLAAVLFVVAASLIRETLKLRVVENRQKAALVSGFGFLVLAPLARLMLHYVYHTDPVWPR